MESCPGCQGSLPEGWTLCQGCQQKALEKLKEPEPGPVSLDDTIIQRSQVTQVGGDLVRETHEGPEMTAQQVGQVIQTKQVVYHQESGAPKAGTLRDLGYQALDSRNPQKALSYFERTLELDSGESNSWLGKGFALLAMERQNEFQGCLRRAMNVDLDVTLGFYWCDRFLNYQQGKLAGLVNQRAQQQNQLNTIQRNLKKAPVHQRPSYVNQISTVQAHLQYTNSKEVVQRAIVSSLEGLKDRLLDLGLSRKPRDVTLLKAKTSRLIKASANYQPHQLNHLLGLLKTLAELEPKDPGHKREQAQVLLRLERYQECLECTGKLLAANGRDLPMVLTSARALGGLNHYARAWEAFQQALALDPKAKASLKPELKALLKGWKQRDPAGFKAYKQAHGLPMWL